MTNCDKFVCHGPRIFLGGIGTREYSCEGHSSKVVSRHRLSTLEHRSNFAESRGTSAHMSAGVADTVKIAQPIVNDHYLILHSNSYTGFHERGALALFPQCPPFPYPSSFAHFSKTRSYLRATLLYFECHDSRDVRSEWNAFLCRSSRGLDEPD